MSQAAAIEKNYDVLLRCTTINCYVIDCLKAENIIDIMQEAKLRAKRNSIKQCDLLFTWLKEVSSKKYESFLEVMNDTEQEHVANLLCGSTEDDDLPLSEIRHRRLDKIRPKIANVISIDIEMIAELRKFRAISRTDAEDIRAETVDYAKISKLISAIMRRSNHCYNSLREVLRITMQTTAAAYLSEGEMLAVHVNNNRPDMDGNLSSGFNEAIQNNSDVDTCIKEQLLEMNGIGLNLVKAIPGQSIVIFVYCETVQNAVTFTQLLNSGRLLQTLDAILNRLLLKFEPHNTEELGSCIRLEEEEVDTLEEFTGIEGWMRKRSNLPKPVGKINGCDAATQTTEDHFTMNKTETRGRGYMRPLRPLRTAISSSCLPRSVGYSISSPDLIEPTVDFDMRLTDVDEWSMKKSLPDALIYKRYPSRIGSRLRMIGDDSSGVTDAIEQSIKMVDREPSLRSISSGTKPLSHLALTLREKKMELEAAERAFEDEVTLIWIRIRKHAQMYRALVERDEKRLLQQLDETINASMSENHLAISSILSLIQRLEKAEQKGEAGTDELEQLITTRINTTQFKNFYLSLNAINVLEERNIVGELMIAPIQDHSSFLANPVLIGLMPADDQHQAVTGVTTLDREIFITRDGSQDISVYSVMTNTYLRSLSLLNLLEPILVPSPVDVAACRSTRTLYVADESNQYVYRLHPDGKLIHWWTVDNLRSLSITTTGTVLVGGGGAVREYESSGKLVRTISTSPLMFLFRDRERPSMKHPTHFLETNDGRIVACDFPADASRGGLHVVYNVDREGSHVTRWHGNRADSGDKFLNEPSHLAIDVTGHVMVADRLNNRVKLLDSKLKFVRDLIGPHQWFKNPQRLHYDPIKGFLYVGLATGDTLVFKVTL